ncbi:MAG: hypothetical protein P4L90_18015 [Rhodopila sp.]|nr:hypothetical protein [Rhodopila sp.]
MISDDPDEDADALDDDTLLEGYFGGDTPKPEAETSVEPQDWPPTKVRDAGLSADSETVAWFKTNHADWRHQMRCALRAWVVARTQEQVDAAQANG